MALKDNSLIHLVYASAAAPGLSEQEIVSLAVETRERNLASGVTGMLLYSEQSFFQVLEGPRLAVEALHAGTARDPRHRDPSKVFEGPVTHRSFADWSTGLAFLNGADPNRIPGGNDFFGSGSCLQQLDDSTTRNLLEGFKTGAWHVTAGHASEPATDIGLDLIEQARARIDKSDLND